MSIGEDGDSGNNSISSSETKKHSPLAFLFIILFGFSALILGCIQNFNCKTVAFPQVNVTHPDDTVGSFDSGPFSYRFTGVVNLFANATKEGTAVELWGVCRSYNKIEDDLKKFIPSYNETMWTSEDTEDLHLVQGMAIAAVILGSVMMLCVCNAPYCGIACLMQWKCYGFMFMITSILQGLSLLIFSSTICLDNPILRTMDENDSIFGQMRDTFGDKCEIAVGAKCGIASTVLWFVTGAVICCKYPPGRYKEDCLTHSLQMSQQEATRTRIEKAKALQEYEKRMNKKQQQQQQQLTPKPPSSPVDTAEPQEHSLAAAELNSSGLIFHSATEQHAEDIAE